VKLIISMPSLENLGLRRLCFIFFKFGRYSNIWKNLGLIGQVIESVNGRGALQQPGPPGRFLPAPRADRAKCLFWPCTPTLRPLCRAPTWSRPLALCRPMTVSVTHLRGQWPTCPRSFPLRTEARYFVSPSRHCRIGTPSSPSLSGPCCLSRLLPSLSSRRPPLLKLSPRSPLHWAPLKTLTGSCRCCLVRRCHPRAVPDLQAKLVSSAPNCRRRPTGAGPLRLPVWVANATTSSPPAPSTSHRCAPPRAAAHGEIPSSVPKMGSPRRGVLLVPRPDPPVPTLAGSGHPRRRPAAQGAPPLFLCVWAAKPDWFWAGQFQPNVNSGVF
jgi:hypothetical protein